MRGVRVIVVSACVALTATAASADFDQSKAWFGSLSYGEQTEIQHDLIWTADYAGVIDGRFGQQTYAALNKYQALKGENATGVLSANLRETLKADAAAEAQHFGMRDFSDANAGLKYQIPGTLMVTPEAAGTGTSFTAADGTATLWSFGRHDAFDEFYRQLTAPAEKLNITYSVYRRTYFVVSGYREKNRFHLFAVNTSLGPRGISFAWSPARPELEKVALAVAGSLTITEGAMVASPASRVTAAADARPDPLRGNPFHKRTHYRDVSGLDRSDTEFAADSGACAMYASQRLDSSVRRSAMMEGDRFGRTPLAVLDFFSSLAEQNMAYDECLQAHYWQPQ